MLRKLIVSALLVISGCMYDGDPNMYGLHVVIDSGMETNTVIADPNFDKRLKRAIERGAEYWRMYPEELAHWRLRIKGDDVWCEGKGGFQGCADFLNFTITITVASANCIEMSALLHEMGHIKSYPWGDPYHWDTGWYNGPRMADMWVTMLAEDIPADDICQRLGFPGKDYPPNWHN